MGEGSSEMGALGEKLSDFLDDNANAGLKNVSEQVVLKAREMAGVTTPTDFFDPLGFSTDITAGKLLFYGELGCWPPWAYWWASNSTRCSAVTLTCQLTSLF